MTSTILILLLQAAIFYIPLLLQIAYFTLAERKLLGSIQRRKGPNSVGTFGIAQPLADGLKLFVKETILPSNRDASTYVIAPIITFFLSLISWVVIPTGPRMFLAEVNLSILYIIGITSLHIYGALLAGWSSNSKYSFLGALRASAQMISYELSVGFTLLSVCVCTGSLNIMAVIDAQEHIWYIIPLFPLFLIFCISMLAETNRPPFDMFESESELVSGYHTEYSGMGFALFSLGEYSSMLFMSSLGTILFLGGYHTPLPISMISFFNIPSFWFGLKVLIFMWVFIAARGVLPRYKYNQLMALGWKTLLPITIAWFLLTTTILITFNWLP